jgi:UDP-N-acetyl-alpha-D-muramoyl-L-alanyl-L-glutamate epimerase
MSDGVFRYEGFQVDPGENLLSCHYSAGGHRFTERARYPAGGAWEHPAASAAARLVYLLAGVSYYKTAAPPVIDLGDAAVTPAERRFLRAFYTEGLAEFGYRNHLDLAGLRIEGPQRAAAPVPPGTGAAGRAPLVPFGGGIDSIVTLETVRRRSAPALFIVGRPGDRYAAIEAPAAVTGLPVLRAEREIDPQLLRSAELNFLNGHVPVTGIISALAVLAAVLNGRDAVVMSNEWSASIPTRQDAGRAINHQWSKSASFETGFRAVLAETFGPGLEYFSELRPFSELWVAQRFARLTAYHATFRSCNRAFHIDRSKRLDHWCGRCDKCCFIDLILAPFLPAAELDAVFGGHEPLAGTGADPDLADRFRALLGTSEGAKPFECVGEVNECRAATLLAAQRPDRGGTKLLQVLAAELAGLPVPVPAADLLRPLTEHHIPDAYAPDDLLG